MDHRKGLTRCRWANSGARPELLGRNRVFGTSIQLSIFYFHQPSCWDLSGARSIRHFIAEAGGAFWRSLLQFHFVFLRFAHSCCAALPVASTADAMGARENFRLCPPVLFANIVIRENLCEHDMLGCIHNKVALRFIGM